MEHARDGDAGRGGLGQHDLAHLNRGGYLRFEHAGYGATVTMTLDTPDANLTDVLERFTEFLRGCGYRFDGDVEIVDHLETTDTEGDGTE